MQKKIFLYITVFFLLNTMTPYSIHAQTDASLSVEQPLQTIEAKITSDDLVRINKKAIFDASDSILPLSTVAAEYIWDFGSGPKVSGKEVVQQFSTFGKKTITLTIRQADKTVSVSKEIFVFDSKAFLILDQKKDEEVEDLKKQAAENGVALQLLPISEKEGVFLTEDALVQKIKENADYIRDASVIMFYTQSPLGMQAFNLYWKDLGAEDKKFIQNKFLAVISDNDLGTISNIAYQTFNIIQPNYILLTRKEAINPIFITKDTAHIVDTLKNRSIEYKIIDERGDKSPAFFLSHFMTGLVAKGVSSNIIYIILIVPFLAFIAAFARQVIGISIFGIYTPVIIGVSFLILGLGLGVITFLFAVAVGYLVKSIVNKFELLYLPKIALNLALTSLSFLVIIWVAIQYGTPLPLSMAVFPMLVMSTVSEKFMAAQSEDGVRGAIAAVVGTLLVVIGSYYLITWSYAANLLLAWPELVLAPLIATVLLGKFTGLRLAEYVRFRSLLTEHQE
jgi:hypothetical protein